MRRTGFRFRLLTVALIAIHVAGSVIAPWADGRLEAESRSIRAHAEMPGSHHAPVHRTDCALCQYIGIGFTRPEAAPALAILSVRAVPVNAEDHLAPTGLGAPTSLPRGPPVT